MSESLGDTWDSLTRWAAEWDEGLRTPGRAWTAPNLSALVHAARHSSLGRYYPSASHASLRFSTEPESARTLQVGIALSLSGGYLVHVQPTPDEPRGLYGDRCISRSRKST
ncbi:DUF6193 family natural product biosynthesis protein [Kitasatospora sp. NPDC002227]|uniref:DUF6193 family natural product biosynthesis protein n=1 Tax=Kitasatospora sp. NPDC002227 TaxID=3154773 RepID=UPI0033210F01